jgi:hypothetical protein
MDDHKLLRRPARKGANMDRAAAAVIKDPKLVPELFLGLKADKAAVRFGSSKVLLIISEKDPAVRA